MKRLKSTKKTPQISITKKKKTDTASTTVTYESLSIFMLNTNLSHTMELALSQAAVYNRISRKYLEICHNSF